MFKNSFTFDEKGKIPPSYSKEKQCVFNQVFISIESFSSGQALA